MAVIPEGAILKLAKASAITVSGQATIEIKVPAGGRLLLTALVWFDNPQLGDYISVCEVFDKDDILGYGANFIVESFIDNDMSDVNSQGWFFPKSNPELLLKGISNRLEVIPGLYLKMIAIKSDNSNDTLRANIRWGKR